ncbi:DUF4139 domain-containing protein [Sulfurimonas sp.]
MKTLSLTIISSILLTSNLIATKLEQNPISNSLVIYNSNVGLVHESRELKLNKNDNEIIYEGVASTINTDSVNLNLPDSISLFSQQYRFDKLTQKKLLDAHIGKRINVKIKDSADKFKTIKATLLSNDGTSSIVKTKNKNIITVDSKNIIFKTIPNELITKPSLVWNVASTKNIDSKLDIDYLISAINWKSNYILNIKNDKADISGWITIDNRSGKAFKDTMLHVLAGDINRAQEPRMNYKTVRAMSMMAEASPDVQHQAHEGYHFYSIPFKVNLANNEKTQIKFITEDNISIKRKYTSTMSYPNSLRGERKHDVSQYVTLSGFEYPLPKGIVRTYSKLQDTNILLGETYIQHTAKDTPISLKLGKNFDIKVTETMIKKDDRKWSLESEVKYSVKNSSKETKTVKILVPFNKNEGSNIKTKEKYTFTKGNFVTFNIIIKPQTTKEFKVTFKSKKQG